MILLLIAVVSFCGGCASMGPPGGGPEDKTSPTVIGSIPDSGAVGVNLETDIFISFSEPIRPSTFAEALFFSPPSVEYKKIRWRKNRASILLENPIPENTTVVVTIGSILQDWHRNSMSESFTLAFSTGDALASGQISGAIMGDKRAKGMLVGAWRTNLDTLMDPSQSIAPFVTQVGENNTFMLNYLATGPYRVILWSDKNRDRKYDPVVDKIGLPYQDIVLENEGKANLNFFVAKIDTGNAFPLLISSIDQHHVSIRYNRTPSIDLNRLDRFAEIEDSLEILKITHGWLDPSDSTRLVLRTNNQVPNSTYKLKFSKDTTEFVFNGSEMADTTWAEIAIFSPKDGARNVTVKPSGWIAFKDAITTSGKEELLSLFREDSIKVPIEFQVNMANRIIWKTIEPLPEGSRCELRLRLSEISDLSNNTILDSIWTSKFTILKSVELGEISGSVSGSDGGSVQVTAEPLSGRGESYKVEVKSDGKYIIKNLPAGRYTVWAYEDFNLNSNYDTGSLIPFRFSERLAISNDTLTVRSRWETAGAHLNFR